MAVRQEGLQDAPLQHLFLSADNCYRLEVIHHRAGMLTEVNRLLRHVQNGSCRVPAIAAAKGRVLFVGVAVLVMTVGTLAARSRLPTEGESSNTWHTAKVTRITEPGRDATKSVPNDNSWPAWINIPSQPITYFPAPEIVFSTLAETPPQHGLRAPPLG
jgi:hypothetical protein